MNEVESVHINFTDKKISYLCVIISHQILPHENSTKRTRTLNTRLHWKCRQKENSRTVSKFIKMYWLLGRCFKLLISNKLFLCKKVLKPVWTMVWSFGDAAVRVTGKLFRISINQSIEMNRSYTCNDDIHNDLKLRLLMNRYNDSQERMAVTT